MKKTDLAYYAGLFDGDGSVTLSAQKARGRCIQTTYSLSADLASTNEWICQQLKFAFGGNITQYQPKNQRARMVWRWSIGSKNAQNFLEAIYPYLKLKKPQAEIAIKFQKHKAKRGGRKRGTEYIDFEKELKEAITRVNKPRGKKDGNSS